MQVVLFVTVRANEMHKIGFLEDHRRLNVALTRAQHALVVLGHRPSMQQLLPHWQDDPQIRACPTQHCDSKKQLTHIVFCS